MLHTEWNNLYGAAMSQRSLRRFQMAREQIN